ncbi:MAG: twin-arginine translocation pathway signal protein, partial [Rhodobacterales bacterium 17-64-5]
MTLSRRRTLALIGGGVILAATAGLGAVASRKPRTALLPWDNAGLGDDPRKRALSYALLAPNPHNRQPWLVDLRQPGEVTLFVDTAKLLPKTDPFNRQITIGLGCFLELMRMAASHDGQRVEITPFPDGFDDRALDARPVARATFAADPTVTPDPLFAHALDRRSTKEPYDLTRPLPADTLDQLAVVLHGRFGGTIDAAEVAAWRAFTHEALRIEIETPRTYKESVDLFRIGRAEVDANPDGIDFTGPLFETLG